MSIFVIFRATEVPKLEQALAQHVPDRFLEVGPGEYLVSATGTANALSDKLGITSGAAGAAIVFKMESYHGRAQTSIWDWIKSESEKVSG